MFGFVKPSVPDLLVREHEFYKATYCGICRAMKKCTGGSSRLFLTYDSVLLALVRTVYLPDADIGVEHHRCPVHPLRRRPMLRMNDALRYTAEVFALLSYYKCRDDLSDERGFRKFAASLSLPLLRHGKRRAGRLPLAQVISQKLGEISALEREMCASVDTPAALFGEMLGEIFAFGFSSDDRTVLWELGFHLGKFIYAADAAKDYAEDVREGKYNPYAVLYGGAPLTEENLRSVRTGLSLECRAIRAAAVLLPYGERKTLEHLIQNILCEGLDEALPKLPDEKEK